MKKQGLIRLILILSVVLAALIAVAIGLGFETEDPIPDNTAPAVTETSESAASVQTVATENSTETSNPTETAETEPPEPQDADFVRVADYIPDVVVDLKYAGTDNFTGQQIYDFTDVYLRYGTVKKLILVQQTLRQQGLGLKIWDGFRPPSAQFKLWDICPDSTYVANPNTGFGSHSRGNTVDITLVDSNGNELVMPTGFDDFSKLADRDYSDCTQEAAANAQLLQNIMTDAGFSAYWGEWWHYSGTVKYDVEKEFVPQS